MFRKQLDDSANRIAREINKHKETCEACINRQACDMATELDTKLSKIETQIHQISLM